MKRLLIIFWIMTTWINAYAEEYGIFLLPTKKDKARIEKITHSLKQKFQKDGIPFNDAPNTDHCSIFQGVFEESQLDTLAAGLEKIAQNHEHLCVTLDPALLDTEENIFLNFKDSEKLIPISDAFYKDNLHQLRDRGTLMAQVQRDIKQGVSEKNQSLINTYGLYWNTPGKYNPHFTLIYGSNVHGGIDTVLKSTNIRSVKITFDRIGIGRLGFDGNVTEVVREIPLG